MKDIIKTILYEWKERKLPIVIERDFDISDYLTLEPKKIILIHGFRRVGKTYFVFQTIQKLLSEYTREQVLYLNFEDERIPQKTEFLSALIPTIKETYKDAIKFLFLDEVQNIPHYSKWLRRIYDEEQGIRIIVTGSSSKISSKEIPTELRGREMEIQFSPLAFKEYLRFKNIAVDENAVRYAEDQKAVALKALNEYILYGGLPEVVLMREEKRLELIQQYYATVLRKDIADRFHLRNEEGLKALVRILLTSPSFSISKLYNTMKSLNYAIGKSTIQRYVGYLVNAYFLYPVPIFSWTIKDQLQYPRKAYFVDNGFITALSTRVSDNWGRLYENAAYSELMRRTHGNIFYWKNAQKKEVDFVLHNGEKVRGLVQACYRVDDRDTYKREVSALISGSEQLHCANLTIINESEEGEKQFMRHGHQFTISFVPLWGWLLKA